MTVEALRRDENCFHTCSRSFQLHWAVCTSCLIVKATYSEPLSSTKSVLLFCGFTTHDNARREHQTRLIEKLFPSRVYCLIIYGESRWKAQRSREACNNELWKQGYDKEKLWQKRTKDDESETGSIYRNGKWVCMFKSMIKYRKVQSKGRDELASVVAYREKTSNGELSCAEKRRSISAEWRPAKK